MSDTETHCDAGYCQLAETTDYAKKLEVQLLGCEARLRKVAAALRGLLRFAENTESELGIILGSADKARAVLAEIEKGN